MEIQRENHVLFTRPDMVAPHLVDTLKIALHSSNTRSPQL